LQPLGSVQVTAQTAELPAHRMSQVPEFWHCISQLESRHSSRHSIEPSQSTSQLEPSMQLGRHEFASWQS
jgi:hypothetical protein